MNLKEEFEKFKNKPRGNRFPNLNVAFVKDRTVKQQNFRTSKMGGSESSERSEYCERVAGAEYEKCLDYVPSHICEKISDATFVSCMLSGENR